MADQNQTGPWVLALGALAIGAGAAARLLHQQRTETEPYSPERD